MLEGTVRFNATIKGKGNGVTFPLFEFNPRKSGIEKVEIGAPNGRDSHEGSLHHSGIEGRGAGPRNGSEHGGAEQNRLSLQSCYRDGANDRRPVLPC